MGLTFARAAERAIALGGTYDGHTLPDDINAMTTAAATALAGRGVMGVAKDNFETSGRNMSYAIGFAEVEVDVETGTIALKDYKVASDAGTIINPRTFAAPAAWRRDPGVWRGAGTEVGVRPALGAAHLEAVLLRTVPPTMLDVPHDTEMQWVAANEADPFNPVGARGIGEAPQGAGAGAVLCAIADALGEGYFNRSPVMTDMILTQINGLPERSRS